VAEEVQIFYGTGRRKEAVARVWIQPGTGKYTINRKDANEVITRVAYQQLIYGPLKDTGLEGTVDVKAFTKGGGITGQAGALRLGLARALVTMNEENRKALRVGGHLTRDPRMKERKKYGQPGARKRYQFSKR
jgi:small subunit ribosomal protein S9